MMPINSTPLTFLSLAASSLAFAPSPLSSQRLASSTTPLHLFGGLDKAFEESGPLGKGITVGKIQVALRVSGAERTSRDSIFALLENQARNNDGVGSSYDSDYNDGYGDSHLSNFCHKTCLALLRKSDDWVSACSDSEWFKQDDVSKAESKYNLWGDREACKFEKEYVPPEGTAAVEGNPTIAIVSLIIEIEGDETNFDRAGFSLTDTKSVLTNIASDSRVEGGDCLNAFEVFWTPSEPKEVLTERDIIVDFPELITL